MHDCVYAALGYPEKCRLKVKEEAPAPTGQDRRQAALDAFFMRKARRCPACRKKVDARTSAGGRRKRYHATCV